MERWLSKSRVLLGLCAVLLIAALNRQDPMVYAMFLFLGVLSLLGFALPWLSLRSTTVRLDHAANIDVIEGAGSHLNILLQRTAPWPAFMLDIETEWTWAGQRIVLNHTVPVLRAGRALDVGQLIAFPCRGYYELVAVRLSSGFPLGLMRASHNHSRPQIHLCVLPKAQPVQWPMPWAITEDPVGEQVTRRLGPSFELGLLRSYQHGDPVGRVCPRASARAGELVIQHFQQSGSVRLRVAVQAPEGRSLGDATGAGEQAIRLAAGVCQAALEHNAQLFLYLEHLTEPVRDASAVLRALAQAASNGGLAPVVARIATAMAAGEQVAVVVSGTGETQELLQALGALAPCGGRVLICIALGRRSNTLDHDQAQALQTTLRRAGFATLMAPA